jgi:polysaccharide biosynthesis/export protein
VFCPMKKTIMMTMTIVLALAAATPAQTIPATPAAGTASELSDHYMVNPLDTLSVTVVGEPDLTNKYKVDIDGSITLPYIGRQTAAGLSIADLQTKIGRLLKDGYLQNPQVLIDVDQFKTRAVYVMGKVRHPGKVTMNGPSITLMEALALAGSTLSDANNVISVKHLKSGELLTVNRKDLELGKTGFDVMLEDGDVVNVPGAQQFYITGMVRNSGTFVLDPGMTFAQAIAVAGGLTERGSDRRITVTRVVKGKTVDVKVDLDDKVQPNDTIKIPTRFF